MGKFFQRWKNFIILLLILAALIWVYSLFNGGSPDSNLWKFLKTTGLQALIVVIIVSIAIILFQKVFRTKIRH